ncbi:aminotransferase class I/II-fold pyridoxal phosphate-dependent enzyme [Rapidithrix thailandica]|uniref:Aminotransferase class I/II-fold pyridoxal phosphate-dependent enzyme n=1 Tax=Rapidithrix thailandica TaxID=413964 RepID=A0AAW9SKE8_9BACT
MDNNFAKKLYDPGTFREQGHQMVNLLADYLEKVSQQKDGIPVTQWKFPNQQLTYWQEALQNPKLNLPDFFQQVLDQSIHLHHPKYIGHQVSPVAPLAALTSLVSSFLNNGMAVYEMGATATAMERLVIQELSKVLGFDEQADGFLTSGGTLATLTALLAARQKVSQGNIWEKGLRQKLAVMVSEEAHYCIDRACRIMGFGAEGVIKIPVNAQFQMDTSLLEEYYQQAQANGFEVIAIVGSACSTSTGSYDNLEAIGRFCQGKPLWFHIDGAHGGAVAYSSRYASLLKGVTQADSIIIDYHKMLLTPALATAVVFREGKDSYSAFAQKAQYLYEQDEQEWHELGKRTFECTKYMMGFKVYTLLRTYGPELFEANIDYLYQLTQRFARLIESRQDLELALRPQANIICFRYTSAKKSTEELNTINRNLRRQLLEKGEFYIVQTQLKGLVYLRATLMNPLTTELELTQLLDTIGKLLKAEMLSTK